MSDIPRANRELGELIAYAEMPDDVPGTAEPDPVVAATAAIDPPCPVSSVKLTPSVKQRIHDIKRENPKLSEQEIAVLVNVNAGRVSETLTGKRGKRYAIEGYQP
jgi:hypothetical protein